MMPSIHTMFIAHFEMPLSLVLLGGSRCQQFPEAEVRSQVPLIHLSRGRDTDPSASDIMVQDSMLKACLQNEMHRERLRG